MIGGDEERGASAKMPEGERSPEEFLRAVVAPAFEQQVEALRARIATLERELADREAAEASVRIQVDGDGGGTWYLNVQKGRMEVQADPSQPVLFSITQSAADWDALVRGGTMLGAPGGSPASGGRGAFTRSRIERLLLLEGTVRFVIRADDGAERVVTLHLGPGDPANPPRTTITLREADARRLREGSLDPQAAFLQGLVSIGGDMGLAIQLGTALFL
jgi:putative sterol carrier protein